jgi:hypothetical protein
MAANHRIVFDDDGRQYEFGRAVFATRKKMGAQACASTYYHAISDLNKWSVEHN